MKGSFLFDDRLNAYFKSIHGAYSKTTETEGDKKRQYNVKADQRDILESVFGEELKVRFGEGGKAELERKGIDASSTMRVYPSGQKIEVTLVYPKKNKRELRIYFSGATFKANAHDYVLIYVRNGEPWIGAISEVALNIISAGAQKVFELTPREENLEEEVDDYQSLINKVPELIEQQTKSLAWKRDAKIAKSALEKSGFKCELFPDQPTFTAKSTGKPFMEVHHLLPMKHQANFSNSLDVIENLCVLNPTAHRLIHHAEYGELEPYLKTLFSQREQFLQGFNVGWAYMESIYQ